jgi:hypothetical protein
MQALAVSGADRPLNRRAFWADTTAGNTSGMRHRQEPIPVNTFVLPAGEAYLDRMLRITGILREPTSVARRSLVMGFYRGTVEGSGKATQLNGVNH